MLDSVMGLAIQSTLDRGIGSTTLEFKMSFLRPITPKDGSNPAPGALTDLFDVQRSRRQRPQQIGFIARLLVSITKRRRSIERLPGIRRTALRPPGEGAACSGNLLPCAGMGNLLRGGFRGVYDF
jgi:hypothetical protein